MFLLRIDAAEQVDARQGADQRLVRHLLQIRARQHARDGYADLVEHVAAHLLVVAGQHLHRHTRLGQRADGLAGARFGRIEEHSEAGEHQVRLVANRSGRVARVHHAARDAQRPEPLFTQSLECLLEAAARGRVERNDLAVPLVAARQAQHVLGRTLHDQPPLVAMLDEHGNPATLEVEWHLVDLAPRRHVERPGADDRFVERTFHAALEPAVDASVGIGSLTRGAVSRRWCAPG